MQINWSDELLTGNESIDKQHKELFRAANTFLEGVDLNADNSIYIDTLNYLVEYVKNHFADEEKLMLSLRYPLYDTHREAHLKLTRELVAVYKDLIDAGMNTSIAERTRLLIEDWLTAHINYYDKKLALYAVRKSDRQIPQHGG